MPLFKEWSNNNDSLAAIWEITEPEHFFIQRTGITREDIASTKRRMEHLAGRFLLTYLEKDFPLLNIYPDEHDKPRTHNNEFFFSISHSWPFVAAIISPYEEVGIDIQAWRPNMQRLQHKFLSGDEQGMFQNNDELITLAWCAKEAAYKWQGRRGVEFIDHLPITYYEKDKHGYNLNILASLTSPNKLITLEGFVDEAFACSYVVDARDWAIY